MQVSDSSMCWKGKRMFLGVAKLFFVQAVGMVLGAENMSCSESIESIESIEFAGSAENMLCSESIESIESTESIEFFESTKNMACSGGVEIVGIEIVGSTENMACSGGAEIVGSTGSADSTQTIENTSCIVLESCNPFSITRKATHKKVSKRPIPNPDHTPSTAAFRPLPVTVSSLCMGNPENTRWKFIALNSRNTLFLPYYCSPEEVALALMQKRKTKKEPSFNLYGRRLRAHEAATSLCAWIGSVLPRAGNRADVLKVQELCAGVLENIKETKTESETDIQGLIFDKIILGLKTCQKQWCSSEEMVLQAIKYTEWICFFEDLKTQSRTVYEKQLGPEPQDNALSTSVFYSTFKRAMKEIAGWKGLRRVNIRHVLLAPSPDPASSRTESLQVTLDNDPQRWDRVSILLWNLCEESVRCFFHVGFGDGVLTRVTVLESGTQIVRGQPHLWCGFGGPAKSRGSIVSFSSPAFREELQRILAETRILSVSSMTVSYLLPDLETKCGFERLEILKVKDAAFTTVLVSMDIVRFMKRSSIGTIHIELSNPGSKNKVDILRAFTWARAYAAERVEISWSWCLRSSQTATILSVADLIWVHARLDNKGVLKETTKPKKFVWSNFRDVKAVKIPKPPRAPKPPKTAPPAPSSLSKTVTS
ncbi:hypothetical protein NEDG_01133 [Nematocida displodere]|uniref:Uncharacterized protein n=1 Tax=Nematocida displodere TaxID=1805483 RepID=A0A177EAM7_9MICR|nr:hypothetical protein NEDG_01133 [Nematocida displodere]